MRPTTLAAAPLLAAALILVAAACGGGSSSHATTTATTTVAASPAVEKGQIEQVWTSFFSSKTPPPQKASMLQNGSHFLPVIQQMSKSPLASHTSATVSKVTLLSPTKATVVYTIDLAGKPALQHQTGVAVKDAGGWKVGDASFCTLLGLQGSKPASCKSP